MNSPSPGASSAAIYDDARLDTRSTSAERSSRSIKFEDIAARVACPRMDIEKALELALELAGARKSLVGGSWSGRVPRRSARPCVARRHPRQRAGVVRVGHEGTLRHGWRRRPHDGARAALLAYARAWRLLAAHARRRRQ